MVRSLSADLAGQRAAPDPHSRQPHYLKPLEFCTPGGACAHASATQSTPDTAAKKRQSLRCLRMTCLRGYLARTVGSLPRSIESSIDGRALSAR